MTRKKILVISYSHLNSDPRVRRQIEALAGEFDILTAGLSPVGFGNFPFYQLSPDSGYHFRLIDFHFNKPFLVRKTVSLFIVLRTRVLRWRNKIRRAAMLRFFPTKYAWLAYWDEAKKDLVQAYKNVSLDAVLANDMVAVPVAHEIASAQKAKVIFDAHEYSPGENDTNEYWVKFVKPLIFDICKRYLPKVDLMYNVCQGIADEYEKNFGKRSIVVTNATNYYDLKPVPSEAGRIKMVHHGAAIAERHIDLMIKMVDLLDERFTLDLILVPTQGDYYRKLEEMLKENSRVRMLPAVKTEEIPHKTNHYDIGLFLLPPVNLNYHFALPNKLFEFIQARLAVVIGPSPEMKRITEQYGLGIVSKSFEIQEMANLLNALTPEDIMRFKQNSHACAKELNSGKNAEILVKSISGLFSEQMKQQSQ